MYATYENIIGLYVSVHDVELVQQRERKQSLLCVRFYGANVETNILAKAFDDIPQIHTMTRN